MPKKMTLLPPSLGMPKGMSNFLLCAPPRDRPIFLNVILFGPSHKHKKKKKLLEESHTYISKKSLLERLESSRRLVEEDQKYIKLKNLIIFY